MMLIEFNRTKKKLYEVTFYIEEERTEILLDIMPKRPKYHKSTELYMLLSPSDRTWRPRMHFSQTHRASQSMCVRFQDSLWPVRGDIWPGPWSCGRQPSQTFPCCDLSPLTSGCYGAPVCHRRTTGERRGSETCSPPPCLRNAPAATKTAKIRIRITRKAKISNFERKTATYHIRYEIHSLIRSPTRRSCGVWWGLCTPTGWWGSIGGWTGSCCCWSGLCQSRTAAPRGRGCTCWALPWDTHREKY